MDLMLKVLSVLLMGVFKFMFAAPLSYRLGFDPIATFSLLLIGGGLGMVGFFFAGSRVMEWFRVRHLRREHDRAIKGLRPRRIFTRSNRMIVHVKHRYGLIGLAVMPPILSIPITAVIAAKYFHHDRRALPVMLVAVAVWSLVLSGAWIFVK